MLKDLAQAILLCYLRVYDAHLNITGAGFNSIHSYTDELKNELIKDFDRCAEIARQKGEIVSTAVIKEDGVEIDYNASLDYLNSALSELLDSIEAVDSTQYTYSKGVENFLGDIEERVSKHLEFFIYSRYEIQTVPAVLEEALPENIEVNDGASNI
jgi:DNA-binding ferritin-like protein